MENLKVISRLLDYPTETVYEHLNDIKQLIETDPLLGQTAKNGLVEFIEHFAKQELLEWQSYYDGLFERGRAVSLLLFEHIHGESRDRGQAMIDLQQTYKEAGLEIGVKELPDYIPLFLEFLSTQGDDNARSWLQDVSHILALLAARLQKRDSVYQHLFLALLDVAQAEIDMADVQAQIKSEERDDTPKALDKVWEEEMVTFGPDQSCGTDIRPTAKQSKQNDVPIGFVDAAPKHQNAAQAQ